MKNPTSLCLALSMVFVMISNVKSGGSVHILWKMHIATHWKLKLFCVHNVDIQGILGTLPLLLQTIAFHQLSVMRCIYSTPTSPPPDSWKHTSIFQTYTTPCGNNRCQLVIDGGSTLNVISKTAVDRLQLQAEPHPHPFHDCHVKSCGRENTYTFQHEGKNITLKPSNSAIKPTKDVQTTLSPK
ncbi:unnamed protein product [Prunus brigantina]